MDTDLPRYGSAQIRQTLACSYKLLLLSGKIPAFDRECPRVAERTYVCIPLTRAPGCRSRDLRDQNRIKGQTRMMLESRGASCSGRFTFEGHVISLSALYEHLPCLLIILSNKSKAGFTLLGVFDGRAFFRPKLSRAGSVERIRPYLYFIFPVCKIRVLVRFISGGEHRHKIVFSRKDVF
jgi:hypothetical protein